MTTIEEEAAASAEQESYEQRAELAGIAGALHAYLEYHRDAGTLGFPRRPWKRPVAEAVAAADASDPVPTPAAVQGAPVEAPSPPAPRPAAAPRAPAEAPVAAAAAPVQAPRMEPRVRLAELAIEVGTCRKCSLCSKRKLAAFGRGTVGARVMFVGEAPGQEDDEQGRPLVGRAGQLLDKMIAAMKLTADEVYVCNVIKCRPPGNRRPEPSEIAQCIGYLHEQISLIRPPIIVALGRVAIGAILETSEPVDTLRGGWRLYRGHTLVLPTYHPSKLLKPDDPQVPELRRQVWTDLQLVMGELARRRATTVD